MTGNKLRWIVLMAAPLLAAGSVPVAKVVLAGDGLTLASATKPAQTIRFNAPRATALAAATAAFGAPTKQGGYGDCGQNDTDFRYAQFKGGIELTFNHGKFTGWTLDEKGSHAFRTANGIGLGSTVAQLKKAYPAVELNPSEEDQGGYGANFGMEENVGPNGFLDPDLKPASKVWRLYAGATCIPS